MYSLVITNGNVVLPNGPQHCDIAVCGETIAGIFPPGSIRSSIAARMVDATGMLVIPGGIDPHVHMYWPLMAAEGESVRPRSRGTEHVGRSALHGGTTTLIDFASLDAKLSVAESIKIRDGDFIDKCPCDYAYHLLLRPGFHRETLVQLAEAIRAGYPTVKLFTTDILPQWKGMAKIDLGDMWEVFKVLAKEGGLGVIHCEEDDLVMHMTAKLLEQGRSHFQYLSEVHSQLSEDMSFRRVLRLAENVPGTALYMMHVSAATGVQAVREARDKKLPVYGETLNQYLGFTEQHYLKPDGQIYHTYPSLKSPEDQDALWTGIADGTVQTIATDDLCCTLQEKTKGRQITDTTGGNSGVELRIAVMYTEAVVRRGISLEKFVALVSTNAAKIMGLYPRKGVIAPGSDADIVLLDPNRRGKVTVDDLHQAEYSPWEGHAIHAWPVCTVLRGQVVFEQGEYRPPTDGGRYLLRKIPQTVLRGADL